MSAWPYFAVVGAVALVAAARVLGRAFALWRALAGAAPDRGGTSWIIGRVSGAGTTPRWLAEDRAAWVEREVVIEGDGVRHGGAAGRSPPPLSAVRAG